MPPDGASPHFAFLATSVTIVTRRMDFEVVSRVEELASLRAFIDEMRGRSAAFVLEGEAGIGKSTLWLAGVEHAHARELRVLSRGRPRPSAASLT